jgi:hypothetical protein
MNLVKRLLTLGFVTGLGLSAAGCDDYRYFDIHVRFDNGTLPTTKASEVKFCRVTVSGADSAQFRIGNCPPPASMLPPGDVGTFTFSSFADGGTMKFTLDAFTSINERPECITGTGTTMVAVPGADGTARAEIVIAKAGESCASITPGQ